ncbi:hypothetical protein F0L68_25610 [Solihabitans fulvus]|uniref:Uncharacterized protein n=1 Tax=Solihabitans fulvus TaxID=1892852 RepID=A0A5B2X1N0_9PSEU|nr:DUF5682 family protein [Solihabitans fulvus]KAA2257118.1 hypothetical protein F0L68_25610 [Solihabitans fulvus]
MSRVTLLGIRHHGPGSARMVVAALDALRPKVVLVEGPPEADPLVAHLAGLTPPVALLLHDEAAPETAAFWPFAAFSPEWQALRWAAAHGVPARFADLPASVTLAEPDGPRPRAAIDPLGLLAEAAGFDDPERWWEDVVEQHREADPLGLAGAVAEAMTALREEFADEIDDRTLRREAAMRQAVRQACRDTDGPVAVVCGAWHVPALAHLPPASADAALVRGLPRRRVSGTWVPWSHGRLARDSGAAGYGAGVAAPGWYAHLWDSAAARAAAARGNDTATRDGDNGDTAARDGDAATHDGDTAAHDGNAAARNDDAAAHSDDAATHDGNTAAPGNGTAAHGNGAPRNGSLAAGDDTVPRWFARACQLLRAEDLPVSTASAVDAVRLADALAALRGRPSPGLAEVTDAALAVLCGGDELPLRLVHERLVVGEQLGTVGPDVPQSPLAADLVATQRRLRLRADTGTRQLRLDLRRDNDRARGTLLRRLRVLDVPWGRPEDVARLGTFAEAWQVRWDPGFAVAVAAAARHGSTVASAAERVLGRRAAGAARVAEAADVLGEAVNCELPGAVAAARAALDRCAAAATDTVELLGALPALAGTVRYGSVRDTDPELLRTALHGLLARGAVGLPLACRGIDDAAAERLLAALDGAHEAAGLAADPAHQAVWRQALARVLDAPNAHGLPAGRATRLLWEALVLDADAVAARLRRAVTAGAGTGASAFVAGFLRGSAALLAEDPQLFGLVDGWLTGLSAREFADTLPLLRRAVAEFSTAERRMLGERVGAAGGPEGAGPAWDEGRAARLAAEVRRLLATAGSTGGGRG